MSESKNSFPLGEVIVQDKEIKTVSVNEFAEDSAKKMFGINLTDEIKELSEKEVNRF